MKMKMKTTRRSACVLDVNKMKKIAHRSAGVLDVKKMKIIIHR